MVNIKNNLLGGNVRGLGFFDGYAQIGSIIKNYSKITGQYQKFTCTFEQLFVNNVKELLKEYTSKKYEVKTAAFDVISGMAGIVQYLLELDAKITKKVLYEASIYLCNLTEEVMYKNRKVPGWFVAGNNILVEMERKRYPNGQVNYGFAHGITGVLASLIKLGENGINKSKVDESIKRILSEIKKVEYVSDEGIYFYPGLLDIENYIDGKYYDGTNLRMSWCYGSISILYTLYRAYYYIKDYDSCEKILNSIEIIAQKGNNCWKLESPIICHGFAGTAHIFKLFSIKRKSVHICTAYKQLIDLILGTYNQKNKYGFKDIYYKEIDGTYKKIFEDKNSFLEGSSGIISVLLGFWKENEHVSSLMLLD